MRTFPAAPLASLLMTACTVAPAPVSRVVDVPLPAQASAPTATASVAPTATPDTPPDAAPTALLARLSAEARAQIEVLAALCPIGVQEKDGKVTAGCLGCPSQSGPDPERIPRTVPAGDPLVAPQAHLVGAFTRPGVEEHLVTMNSCSCNGCLDDAYLVEKGADGFEVKAKVAVRAADDCKRVRRKGQVDRALCDRVLARMGYVATMVEMYDFSKLPAERGATLAPVFEFAAVDNLAMSCAPGAHFLRRSLVKWRLADVDRDGQEELVIDLAVGDGVVTKAVFAACSAENEAAPTKGLPATRRMELTWKSTASGLAATAATAALLKQLDATKKMVLAESGH